jgi:hypothetical protein
MTTILDFDNVLPRVDLSDDPVVLRDQAIAELQLSNPEINVSDASPASLLLGSYAWLLSYYIRQVNELPLATVLSLLELAGRPAIEGDFAVGELEIEFTGNITLDENTFFTATNGVTYVPSENLPVTFTDSPATFPIISQVAGVVGNVESGAITQGEGITGTITSITNPLPTTGGTAPPDANTILNRALKRIKRRDLLLTAEEYNSFATETLGSSVAARTVSINPAELMIFLATPDGPVAPAQKEILLEATEPIKPLGVVIETDDLDLVGLELTIIGRPNISPSQALTNCETFFKQFLDYRIYNRTSVRRPVLITSFLSQFPQTFIELETILINGLDEDLILPSNTGVLLEFVRASFVTQTGQPFIQTRIVEY